MKSFKNLEVKWGGGATRLKLKAFTLAEVLITLGIIGVVAAITLPTVMAKVERNILKQQFKKAYSVYSQALLKTVNDNDGVLNCYYAENEDGSTTNTGQDISGCIDFFENFAQNLKIIKKCDGNALADGCLPIYTDYKTNGDAGCPGFTEEAFNVRNLVYVLADGTILMPYAEQNRAYFMPIFAIDINGKKGPNKPGFDLFSLRFSRTAKGMYRFNHIYGEGKSEGLNGCLPYLNGRLTFEEIMFK